MMKTAIKHKSRRFRRFLKANEAVSALEYAILVGVIAVAVGAALFAFGGEIRGALDAIGNTFEGGVDASDGTLTAGSGG